MSAAVALSLFWFFYFAGIGIHFPYFGLYLRENAGLTPTEVGLVLSAWPLVGLITPPLWGYLADRTGRRTGILFFLTLCTAAGYFSLAYANGFRGLMVASCATAAFGTAVVPMLFSISFGALRDGGPRAFGYTRVWATIGFLILAEAFPWWLHRHQAAAGLTAIAGGPSEPGLELMFPAISVCVVLAAFVALLIPTAGAVSARAQRGQWTKLLRHGPLLRLACFTLLTYLFTQGPMVLFPVWVRAHGGSIDTVGRMWVFMIALEIPLVIASGTSLTRLGVRNVLALGALAAGIRWIACALISDLRLIYAVQLLHGVTVAGIMLGSPMYLDRIISRELRSSGQTFVSTLSNGLGALLSTTISGWIIDRYGIDTPYLIGGIAALLLGLSARWILPEPRPMHD